MNLLKNKNKVIVIVVGLVACTLLAVGSKYIGLNKIISQSTISTNANEDYKNFAYTKYDVPNGISLFKESLDNQYYYFANINGVYKYKADSKGDAENHSYTKDDAIWFKQYQNLSFIQPLADDKCMIANSTNAYILDKDGNELQKIDLAIGEQVNADSILYSNEGLDVITMDQTNNEYKITRYKLDNTKVWEKTYSMKDFIFVKYKDVSDGIILCDNAGKLIKINSDGTEVFNISLSNSGDIMETKDNTYIIKGCGYISIIDNTGNVLFEDKDAALTYTINDQELTLNKIGNIKRLDFKGKVLLELDNENLKKYYFDTNKGSSISDNRFLMSVISETSKNSKEYSLVDQNKKELYKIEDFDLSQVYKVYINDKNELTIFGVMYDKVNNVPEAKYYAYSINDEGKIVKKTEIKSYPTLFNLNKAYSIDDSGITCLDIESGQTSNISIDSQEYQKADFSTKDRFVFMRFPHVE